MVFLALTLDIALIDMIITLKNLWIWMILDVSVFTNFDNITTKDTLGILMDVSHMPEARGLEGKPA